MSDKTRNVVLEVLMFMAGACLILVIIAIMVGFHERGVIARRICLAQVQDRRALRQSFIVARDFSLTSPVRSFAERQRIADFYTRILARTPELRCSDGKPTPVKETK